MIELATTNRPGRLWGDRPERAFQESRSAIERFLHNAVIRSVTPKPTLSRFADKLHLIESELKTLEKMHEGGWLELINQVRAQLSKNGLTESLVCKVFALVSFQMQKQLGIKPYHEQYFAGWSMLEGALAEMFTGEGKTLTIAFPAISVALCNTPVHVITVNEYLVERDARLLGPLYSALGLSVGIVTQKMNDDDRRRAYAADIVYCTNKQIVFDYLKDAQILGASSSGLGYRLRSLLSENSAEPIQRGLCFAIVDEADSVLIDEARVPLILTSFAQKPKRTLVEEKVALGIARTLHDGIDYILHDDSKTVSLTESGIEVARNLIYILDGAWQFDRYRNELIKQALVALHVYRIDRDYIVKNQQVILIDENTGRTMPDRMLQNGLHTMLEIKEKCKLSDQLETTASISFQRFFLKYHRMTGLSGTLREVRAEIKRVYDLNVVSIPPHIPSQMEKIRMACYPDRSKQLGKMLKIIQERHFARQPVLIGTRSVELSQRISHLLNACNIKHELLNAAQDHREALIIAEAGRPGAITVATNMAGRGTDIPLLEDAEKLGGLHVINMEFNESPRIDRQLFGRSARQGAPGSVQSLLSVKDDVKTNSSPMLSKFLDIFGFSTSTDPTNAFWPIIVRIIQWRYERAQTKQRKTVYSGFSELRRQLAISGKME